MTAEASRRMPIFCSDPQSPLPHLVGDYPGAETSSTCPGWRGDRSWETLSVEEQLLAADPGLGEWTDSLLTRSISSRKASIGLPLSLHWVGVSVKG